MYDKIHYNKKKIYWNIVDLQCCVGSPWSLEDLSLEDLSQERVPWTSRRSNRSTQKEISPEYSLERTDAETQILWSPDAKNWLIWKDPDAWKDWRQEEKGTTEDEMVGWHHQLDGHEFEYAPGVGDGQGGLACCSPWGRKELDTTERVTWTVGAPPHLAQARELWHRVPFWNYASVECLPVCVIRKDRRNLEVA